MPSATADISFVILTWNSASYIQECLDSVRDSLKPSGLSYEILIIDNGSSDETPELLKKNQTASPEVVKPIYLLNNQGTTVSRNIGLKQAAGRYICIMDSDVVLSANLFPPLIEVLEADRQTGMVVPKISYPSGRWQKSFDQFPTLAHKLNRFFNLRKMEAEQGTHEQDDLSVRPVDYAISAFWLFKRELLEQVGYLDEKIFYSPEDVDYCLRIWQAGYRISYVPTVGIVHHTQEISRGFELNRAKISHLKGLFYLFSKHGYFWSPPAFRQESVQRQAFEGTSGELKPLHVFDHSLPLHDGYSFRSINILKEQKARGWDPVAVTSPKHEANLGKSCGVVEEVEGFRFFRSGHLKKNIALLTDLVLMHILSRKIREVANRENVDLIHAHSPILNALPALWAAKKTRLPLVYEIRAFWEDAAVDQGNCTEGDLRYRVTRWLETWVCKRADQVVVICEGLRSDLVARGIPAAKITPVFNGVNAEDFQPCPVDDEYREKWGLEGKKVIGFVGSFYRYEGLDLLVRAFAELAVKEKSVALLLVGGGEMEQELKQLVINLGVEERVIMPGRVPHERVPGVYAMIDLLAYPRYSMRLTELVTPLKPLEAMAMGKALVASDVGGHKELIRDGETGRLFKAGDVESLTNALSELLNDDCLRISLQAAGQQWIRSEQTWQKSTSGYRDVYAALKVRSGENE